MMTLGIRNGKLYVDGSFHLLNLYFEGERICAVTEEQLECENVVDAKGKCILPGFIDPHVHFALGVGNCISKDDFYTGSMEGVLGGVTTYIDFLDPVKRADEISYEFEKRNKIAEKSVVDYAFHTTIANPTDSPEAIFRAGKEYGINSVKLFTTYADTDRRTYDGYIFDLLAASKEEGTVVVVHAEHDALIHKDRDILVADHEQARPAVTENIEVMKLGQMAVKTGGNLYLVHVSAGSSVKQLAAVFPKALKTGQITLESCPHYFLLNSEYLKREDGYKYTMTPPIRPEEERLLLREYRDFISTIGTDHCPYTLAQKKHRYTSEIPMGIGGIRYSFLNMYQEYGFSVIDKFTSGPAAAYALPKKGKLLPGYDADVVLFDPDGTTVVADPMSVYAGKNLNGKIEKVFSRGSLVVEDGKVLSHQGRYIRRGEKK